MYRPIIAPVAGPVGNKSSQKGERVPPEIPGGPERKGSKVNLKKVIAGGAIALAAAGITVPVAASMASANVVSTTAKVTPHFVFPWRLTGHNELTLTFQGNDYSYRLSRVATYPVFPGVEIVRGILTDTYEPVRINLPISGVIFGNDVILTVNYPTTGPDAGDQGSRSFFGTIDPSGNVSGTWSETGTEGGSGTWSLSIPATH